MSPEKAKRLRDVIRSPRKDRVVRSDGDGHVEFYNPILGDWSYWIFTKEIQTRRGLLRWLLLISQKSWVTKFHMGQLIEVSCETLLEKNPILDTSL